MFYDRMGLTRTGKGKEMSKRTKNIIVVVGFLLITVVIFATIKLTKGIQNYQKEVSQTIETPQAELDESLPKVVIETEEDIQITISVAGDCTFATDVNYASGPTFVAKYNEVQDPSYFLRNVQSLFAQDDLTIVNFEGTLTNLTTRQDKEFAFRGDPE